MPKTKIVIHVPHDVKISVNAVDYSEYAVNYKIVNESNQLCSFEITLLGIEETNRTDIVENKIVLVKYSTKLFLKGLIQSVEYKSGYEAIIKGYGYGESLLKEKLVDTTAAAESTSPAGRPVYSGVNSATIVTEQLAGEAAVSVGTNDTLGSMSIRGDFDSKVSFLAGLASLGKGDWWFSYGSSPNFTSCVFNISTARGSGSSVRTYRISGSSQNATATSNESDFENLFNSITCLGAGDGANQLRTKAIAAVVSKTTLNESGGSLTTIDTTVTVADASVLPASGAVWIGAEKVSYSGKAGNDLTGCTRWDSGGIVTTEDKKYVHYNGVEVYDFQYTESSPETDSSVDTYGLKTHVLVDRSIIDRHGLDMAAQNYLADHKALVKRVSVIPSDYGDAVYGLNVGDTITVTDEETGLDGDYVIHALILSASRFVEKLEIQVSNAPNALLRELKGTKGEVTHLKQYLQGATCLQDTSIYENCDVSNPLELRFRMPADVTAVTKSILNWRIENYRAYTKTTAAGSAHSHTLDISSGGGHVHSVTAATSGSNADSNIDVSGAFYAAINNDNTWQTVSTVVRSSTSASTVVFFGNIFNWDASNAASLEVRIYNSTDSTYYPSSAGLLIGGFTIEDLAESASFYLEAPDNNASDTLQLQVKSTDVGDTCDVYGYYLVVGDHTHGVTGQTASTADHTHEGEATDNESAHTHDMDYGIDTSAGGSGANVTIKIGEEGGSMTTYTAVSGGVDEDITDEIAAIGSGKTVLIEITPDDECRIEADFFGKVFIESR